MASAMRRENSTRSTASAWPAGTAVSSAMRSSAEPARRISCFSSHGAVLGDSLLSELEQTSSPNSVGLVRGRQARLAVHHRAHLVEIHVAAQPRRGQRRFRPGQAAADHTNPHSRGISDCARRFELATAPSRWPAASAPRRSRAHCATRPGTLRPWRGRSRWPACSSPAPPIAGAGSPFPRRWPPPAAAAPCRCPARETQGGRKVFEVEPGPPQPRGVVEKVEGKAGRRPSCSAIRQK